MKPLKHLHPARMLQFAVIISLFSVSCQKSQLTANTDNALIAKPGPIIIIPPILRVNWVRLADLPFGDLTPGDVPLGRIKLQGFAIGGKGYYCGGEAVTSFTLVQEMKDLWEYDTATHAWTQKASFPGPLVDDATNFVIGTNAYVVVNNQTWQYSQTTNTWTQKASLPTVARAHATGFAINGYGYVGFGNDITNGTGDLADFWQYDPVANSWSQKASFLGANREGAVGFVINGEGYVCSGAKVVSGNPTTYLTDLHQYDPGTNTWTTKPSLPASGRMNGVGLSGLSSGFLLTGSNGTAILNDCWRYTASTNAWTSLPNVGGSVRDYAGGFEIGNNLYIAGGIAYLGSDGMKDFWTLHLYL